MGPPSGRAAIVRVLFFVLALLAAVAALWWLSRDLLPPRSLTFASGAEGGGYNALAQRYAEILARDGIAVEVLTTAGSVENARLLSEGLADVALLQGGITPDGPIETLGSLFLEPVFFFVQAGGVVPPNAGQWRGLRIAAGGEGSGTRAAMMDFAGAAGIAPGANTFLPLGGGDAAAALLDGRADVAIFVAPVGAPYLLPLFASDQTSLLRLDHIETLARRLPQSSLIALPSGAFSLAPPVPAQSVNMLALVARMGAQPGLHPSLVDRLVEAAREIHGPRDAISDDGDFPTMEFAALPADSYARDLLADGPSPLQSFLPYWVVAQVNRFAILLLPIVFLLLPLLRTLPGLYQWRMRRRVFLHYATLRELEDAVYATGDPERLGEIKARLARLDREIASLSVPLPYRDAAFTARVHIDLLRRRIADKTEAADA